MMKFPTGFSWGVATAAYQIEGASKKDGRGESIWDRFSHTPGKVQNGDTGDQACNHYGLYKEDVALIKELGVDSYRFSIAWPRIFPTGLAPVNLKGLDFYKRLLDELLRQGIKPAVTLYHWDLPQALEEQGGWLNRDTAYRFRDYSVRVFQELSDRVHSWTTLNEPWCSAYLGYGTGVHAPGKQNLAQSFQAAHTLLLAHGLTVQAYRELNLEKPLGIVLNLSPQYPASSKEEDQKAAWERDGFQNRWYLDPLFKGSYPQDLQVFLEMVNPRIHQGDLELISLPFDFLGINYYSRGLVQADPQGRPQTLQVERPKTAMGWEVYPQGLYDLLVRVHRDYGPLPLQITENGAAYDDSLRDGKVDDPQRRDYLQKHFAQALRAIEEGVPLEAFYVWSLLDNFEWAYGYQKRFGLIYVDFPSQERIMKSSALWYRDFLRGGNS